MTSKFMKLNQLVVPMITLVLLVSQLTGCALFSQKEVEDTLKSNEQIELVIPDKDDEQTSIPDPIEIPDDTPTEEELGLVEGYEAPPLDVQYSVENDLDKDGAISKSEWEAWVAAHPEDTNKDMYLSPEELGIEAPSYPEDEGDGQPDIVEPTTSSEPEQKPATPAEKPAEKPTTPTQPEQKPTTPTQPTQPEQKPVTQPEQKPSTGNSNSGSNLADLTGGNGTDEEWQDLMDKAGATYDPSTGGMELPSDWFEP